MMCIEPRPLGDVGGGGMLPQEISCSEVAAQAGNY